MLFRVIWNIEQGERDIERDIYRTPIRKNTPKGTTKASSNDLATILQHRYPSAISKRDFKPRISARVFRRSSTSGH